MCDRDEFMDWLCDLPRELNAANNNIARQAWKHQQAKIDAMAAERDALQAQLSFLKPHKDCDGGCIYQCTENGTVPPKCVSEKNEPVDERVAFEAFAKHNGYSLQIVKGLESYTEGSTQVAWEGWQARAALNKGE